MRKNIELKDLIKIIREYNPDEEYRVIKAYNLADSLHSGQMRESGEPYIIHPLNVAYILAEMHADGDTLCAALLHDTLEDTKVKKDEIVEEFNEEVAKLVDGVTKISKLNFSSKKDQNLANTRKIITSITEDVRIIIIKLADRLHNMRTLEHKSEFKQKENAIETIELFAPLAYYIGAYRIKSELEDLSLRYLEPDIYKKISEEKQKMESQNSNLINEMLLKIERFLNDRNIPNEIKLRTKNIYGIYKRKLAGEKISDIHDFHAIKIMVDEIDNCYITLGLVHSIYPPVNDKFKDYISNPKTNMYKSLHTTVFGPNDKLIQTQIRTFDMDKVASFGLTTYWDINKGKARFRMQQDLRNKFQFFDSLKEIDNMFNDNNDFLEQVKNEILTDKIYVYTTKGEIIELPLGSTPIDLAYKLSDEIGNTLDSVYINNEEVALSYKLKNKEIVKIITKKEACPNKEWIEKAFTNHAKKRIRENVK